MPKGPGQAQLRNGRRTVDITPGRKELTERLVQVHDALISDLEHAPECDLVQLHFGSRKQLRDAANLFLRLAVRHDRLASRVRDDVMATARAFSAVKITAFSHPNQPAADEQPVVLDRAHVSARGNGPTLRSENGPTRLMR